MIEKMKFVSISGPKDDIDRVIENYVSQYDIQLENALFELKNVMGLRPFIEASPYKEVLATADTISSCFSTILDKPVRTVTLEDAKTIVTKIHTTVSHLLEKKQALEKEKESLIERLGNVEHFIGLNYDIESILHFQFIKFRFGSFTKEYYKKFMSFAYEDTSSIFYKATETDEKIWGVYFTPYTTSEKVDAIYSSMHFERFFLPDGYKGTPTIASEKLRACIVETDTQIKEIEHQIEGFLDARKDDFFSAHHALTKYNKNFEIRKLATVTRDDKRIFYIICGWLTAKDADALYNQIKEDPDTFCVIENDHDNLFSPPPVKLKNHSLFKPFEMFVEMYGLPNYKEIDPTPLIGITYSILFGFMFGDVGQGLVLFLIGSLLARTKGSRLAAIIARCGFFSMIFGFLFGSIFGFEDIIDALWLHPASAMMTLPLLGNLNTVFIVAVILGMSIILFSMILNIIQRLRDRELGEAFFDTNGIAGFIFYAAAVAMTLLFMTGYTLPASIIMFIMFVLPLLVIMMKEPLTHIIEKKAEILPKEKGMFFVQGFFELIEVLLSYFSNTLSFIRVGAFAVSHAAMMEVVLMLAGAESGSINWFGVVLGNLLVMGMEGLIVGIQVLRLEYYELFSRFYSGNGKRFVPYGKV